MDSDWTQIGLTERQSTLDESLSAFCQREVVLSNNSYWSNSDGIDIENGRVTATNSTIETEILNVNADERFSACFEMSGGSLVVAENPSGNYSGSSPGSLSVRGGKFHVTNDAIVDLQATFSVGETNLSNITAPIPNELSDIKISGGSKLKANSLNVEAGVGDSRITVTGADSAINVTATVFFDTDSFVFPTAGEIGVEVLDGASLTGESIFLAGGATFVQVAENGYLAADQFVTVASGANLEIGVDGSLRASVLDLSLSPGEIELSGRLDIDEVKGSLDQLGGVLEFGQNLGVTVFENDYELGDAASIEFDIHGLLRGEDYGSVSILGLAELDGVLDINFVSGFNANLGDTFQLFEGQIMGDYTFDFSDALLNKGLAFDTSEFDKTGFIAVVSAIPEPNSAAAICFLLPFLCVGRRRI